MVKFPALYAVIIASCIHEKLCVSNTRLENRLINSKQSFCFINTRCIKESTNGIFPFIVGKSNLTLRGGENVVEDGLFSENQDHNEYIVGPMSDFSKLEAAYKSGETNERFISKIAELKAIYCGIRSVKGDGNCFIRGYVFGIMEACIANRTEASGLSGLLTGYYLCITDQSGRGLGYSACAIEDFYQDVQNQVTPPYGFYRSSFLRTQLAAKSHAANRGFFCLQRGFLQLAA